jgi:FtsP/CotA-like multicopper oxidase with cupredoxin domain
MGGGADCSGEEESPLGSNCVYAQFNGSRGLSPEPYVEVSRFVTTKGSVNEWKIFGRADSHPFHIHVNPMQIVSFVGDGTPLEFDLESYFRPGHFRDVLPVLAGMLTVRFRTDDFVGECIYHCHFLRHEDSGETVLMLGGGLCKRV